MVEYEVVSLGTSDREVAPEIRDTRHSHIEVMDLQLFHRPERQLYRAATLRLVQHQRRITYNRPSSTGLRSMSEIASEEAGAPGGLVVRAVLRTDVGLVRAENQDFATYTTPVEERQGHHPGGRLLVVADGMGGHRGGATASRIAGETVKAQYLGS